MNTIKVKHDMVPFVAHRGCSGLEKENTHAAFVAAGNRSYFGIETDVHRTLDGKFICFHDDTTGRVAIDNMVVEQTTFDTLRNLILSDVDGKKGRTDLRMPTLQEYIQICKKYGKIAVLELKNTFEPADVMKIVDIIKNEDYLISTIFISFSFTNMVTLRNLLPEQPCQYLLSKWGDDPIPQLKEYNLDLDIRYTELNAERIKALHDNGIKVNCWTVDDKKAAEELIEWGIDYITTNILE